MYVDSEGESSNLKACIERLEFGDTLYVERMSCLGESLNGAVRELRALALRGVNVWCERSGELLKSKSSPFLTLTEELAQAMVDFRNVFMRFRQAKGRKEAKSRGVHLGKKKLELPENFEEVRSAWRRKEMTLVQAAIKCRMSVSTFWSRAREIERNSEQKQLVKQELRKEEERAEAQALAAPGVLEV